MQRRLVAISPCDDRDPAQTFFEPLGLRREEGPDDYRMLSDGFGGYVYLTPSVAG